MERFCCGVQDACLLKFSVDRPEILVDKKRLGPYRRLEKTAGQNQWQKITAAISPK